MLKMIIFFIFLPNELHRSCISLHNRNMFDFSRRVLYNVQGQNLYMTSSFLSINILF